MFKINRKIMKNWGLEFLVPMVIVVLAIIGEVKCIIKAVKCDWEPSYKEEVIYTASSLLGVGAIVGWINIESAD